MSIWKKIISGTVDFTLVGTIGPMSKEFIDQTNQELSSINIVYDKIKSQRGIN